MDQRTMFCAVVAVLSGCSESSNESPDANPGPNYSTDGGSVGTDNGSDDGDNTTPPMPPAPSSFSVKLVPDGVTGMQRVNFAVPFALGKLSDENAIRILAGNTELPAAHRALAKYADGSVRSVQLQADVDVSTTTTLTLEVGVTGATGPTMAAVSTTTTGTGNNVHPKVWAVLPTNVLIGSTLGGPLVEQSAVAGTPLDAWNTHCNYDQWNTDKFLTEAAATRDVWLYDRVTGAISPLKSAYREAEIYRAGMTITNGVATAIAPPTANDDLKYYYAQNMAMHYLLTGDDRFREAAEAASAKVNSMWNPMYNGADRFWTERNAGFTLLAHEWALMVTDDQAATIAARSEAAVTAYLSTQMTYPAGYTDQTARCFGHSATAHGEDFGYNGCSPWMSAILADGMDQYARRVGGTRATQVRKSLELLGRSIARDGRDPSGRPYYWMGEGNNSDEVDDYEEHWGESAYIVALAWNATGRTDAALKKAADELTAGFKANGEVGRTRSFNWQCRSAVATPALLKN
jgi:hypothetical protein